MNKNVLVLIVTWNGAGVIRRCLNSLRRSVMPIVIYVVDNNSDAETVRIIQEEYPEVILHINSDNIGFGQANNIGLRYAAQNGFDHVMMLT